MTRLRVASTLLRDALLDLSSRSMAAVVDVVSSCTEDWSSSTRAAVRVPASETALLWTMVSCTNFCSSASVSSAIVTRAVRVGFFDFAVATRLKSSQPSEGTLHECFARIHLGESTPFAWFYSTDRRDLSAAEEMRKKKIEEIF